MWNIIGGFVVSSVAEVFVKEIVKEIRKPKKPEKEKPAKASAEPLKHSKGQVMVLDWVPRKGGAAVKRAGTKRVRKTRAA
jgi:hypothetical protein